jgi:lipopolysaccharide transport system ATP-binding protein
MSDIVLKVENLYKQYRLGVVSTGTLSQDLNRWWARMRGKEDPYSKIGDSNHLATEGGEYVWALQDINFEVKRGEVLGIIGKNGAGKSTLLKILSKVTAPTKGNIKVKGRIASLLEVGTGFHPELTGRENIFLNGAILGMTKSEIKRKFDEIVEFSGVSKYIDTPVKRYSSGMYVRLAFAVAAHLEPEILIVDEVLAVGDAEFQKKCLGKMKDVSSEGRTVLFVSHDMSAIKRLCNICLYLVAGSNALIDSTEKVVIKYQENAQFINKPYKSGLGVIQLKEFKIFNAQNQVIQNFNTFDSIEIELTCLAYQDCNNVSFAVCFNDLNNTRITSLWTSFTNQMFEVKAGVFKIRFTIPNIHLIPGVYEIITYIESGGIPFERIDQLQYLTVGYDPSLGLVQAPTPAQGFYIEEFQSQMISTELIS